MKHNYKKMKTCSSFSVLLLCLLFGNSVWGQQSVFWRIEAANGNWENGGCGDMGQASSQWWYAGFTPNNARNRPDCNDGSTTRHNLEIGNNHQTTMTLNTAFWGIRSLTLANSTTSNRTFNGSPDNGTRGISLTNGLFNNANNNVTHTFNVRIGIDAANVTLRTLTNGATTVYNREIFGNNNSITFDGSGNTNVSALISGDGASITKAGTGTLTLSGANTYSGTTTISAGTLRLNREGGNTLPDENNVIVESGGTLRISANQRLNQLTINGGTVTVDEQVTLIVGTLVSNGGTISGTGSLVVENVLNLASGELNTGGIVVLRSTATNTARVAPVGAGASIMGLVTAERYIQPKRAWRLITSPLVGADNNSVHANWQNTGAGTGLLLWNPQAQAGSGMVQGSGIANIYRFGSPNTGWNAVSNTNNEELFDASSNNSFLVFATGPSNETNVSAAAQATTLRPKGNLRAGNIARTINANTNSFLGNPYASALDLGALKSDTDHAAFPTFWLLDPMLSTFGAYVTFDGTDFVPDTNGVTTYSTANTRIESGQAFFVRPNANTQFIFKETHKAVNNGSHSMLRQATLNQSETSRLRVNLYRPEDDSHVIADGILASFDENETSEVTEADSRKFGNTNENIMFRNSNVNLAIDRRGIPAIEEELNIRLSNTTANLVYQLRAFVDSFENMSLQAYLLDTQSQQLSPIPMDGSSLIYPFTAMAATNAQPDDRFKIVFQEAPLSSSNPEQPIMSLYPNPVTNGEVFFTVQSDLNILNVEVYNIHGQLLMNQKAETIHHGHLRMDVSSLVSGVYLLKLSDDKHQWSHKILVH